MSRRELEFGTSLRTVSDVAEVAREVEALGYDIIGCGEHVSFHGPTGNTYVSLAVAAGATRHIRLMSAIVLLPLYPAALAAKMGAALDVASGGRYLFGVGVGGENPREFEACGVPVHERGARTNEALEVIRRLWTEDDVTFHGRFNTLNGITIRPRPVTRPHPPIWVAGRREAAMRRAGRYAEGWLPYMYTPARLAESIVQVRAFAEEAGRPADAVRPGIFAFTCVHPDGDAARRMAAAALGRTYAQDFSRLVGRYAIAGTPQECRARMQEYVEAGATLFMLPPACDPAHERESIRLLAEEVLPAFRQEAT